MKQYHASIYLSYPHFVVIANAIIIWVQNIEAFLFGFVMRSLKNKIISAIYNFTMKLHQNKMSSILIILIDDKIMFWWFESKSKILEFIKNGVIKNVNILIHKNIVTTNYCIYIRANWDATS